ncbi:Arogenate dehydrogenase 1 [Citrus sinensis]|uniref:Arogenate dehydrogenase 1 n=1 Tax=Citrus sinensis TaxID=2711 RepID=A0ACB8L1L6_CITSI|nr:Arogenate dehydrogenase 1 [Citrus sinensis]
MAVSSSSSSSTLKIGIIGFGPFGQFLAKTMIKQGHILRATSRTDHSQLCHRLGISFFSDKRAFLEADNDVILISTSILSLSEVLPEEVDVLCTHPMFGPESGQNGWKDFAFVYEKVRIRDEATCSSFLRIFESEGCKMLEMSCEEHDKVAAKSQFLTHTIGRVLSELEIQSTSMNTKGFETLIRLKESSVNDSFDLFSGLYIHNRFAKQELLDLEAAFEKVKRKLQQKMEVQQEQSPNESKL